MDEKELRKDWILSPFTYPARTYNWYYGARPGFDTADIIDIISRGLKVGYRAAYVPLLEACQTGRKCTAKGLKRLNEDEVKRIAAEYNIPSRLNADESRFALYGKKRSPIVELQPESGGGYIPITVLEELEHGRRWGAGIGEGKRKLTTSFVEKAPDTGLLPYLATLSDESLTKASALRQLRKRYGIKEAIRSTPTLGFSLLSYAIPPADFIANPDRGRYEESRKNAALYAKSLQNRGINTIDDYIRYSGTDSVSNWIKTGYSLADLAYSRNPINQLKAYFKYGSRK